MSERKHVVPGERVGPPRPSDLEVHDASGLDVPLQARWLKRLSICERARYRKALALLAAGGSVRSLIQDGNLPLGLGVYEALLARSWAVRFDDKAAMIRLAKKAVEVAQGLDPKVHGAKQVADLQARARGELANAYRAADQLRSADHAFGQAFALFEQGTSDPCLKVRLFDLEASLLGTWREFTMAEDRLKLAAELYRELGEPHLAGRVLISRALYTFYNSRPEEGLRLNKQGIELIDRRRDPALFLAAMHNELLFLVDLGRYDEAKRRLFKSRRHFIYKDRVNALRLRGLEGRIEYGLGKLLSAEIAFREVKEGFDKSGMSFHAAVISLELAMVLLSQDRFDEAEREVLAVRGVFAEGELYREFLGSVFFLREVFRRRTVTPATIEEAVAHLWRKQLQIGSRHFR